jgi:tripeptide aminopeptidase
VTVPGHPAVDEQRLIDTFLDLVQIPSPSRHERGVFSYVAHALEEVGCEVSDDGSSEASGSDTGNLIATLPGTSSQTIFVTAHMDTAEPAGPVRPRLDDGVIRSDGTTVLGGDDKSGVAVAVEVARVLSCYPGPRPTLKVLLTVQEEVGLRGARQVPDGLFDGALALVCDEDSKPGTVVCAGPFHYTFRATFHGRTAHAAVAPEKGVSAIALASDAVGRMPLGWVGEWQVANVGTISGGSADNNVPGLCTITGECRALEARDIEDVRSRLQRACDDACAQGGGSVDVSWELQYPGFHLSDDDPIVQRARAAAEACGLPFSTTLSLGATDANVFTLKGARCLLVGTGMTDFHTTHESLSVRDLVDTARFVLAICLGAA